MSKNNAVKTIWKCGMCSRNTITEKKMEQHTKHHHPLSEKYGWIDVWDEQIKNGER